MVCRSAQPLPATTAETVGGLGSRDHHRKLEKIAPGEREATARHAFQTAGPGKINPRRVVLIPIVIPTCLLVGRRDGPTLPWALPSSLPTVLVARTEAPVSSMTARRCYLLLLTALCRLLAKGGASSLIPAKPALNVR